MKKIIDSKIVNTEDGEEIATRICARSHSGNVIGWETIMLINGKYYLETRGGNDIYAPADDMVEIGKGCEKSLFPFVNDSVWDMNVDVIAHIEDMQEKQV